MTDQDPRIAEWARADAPEGSPGRLFAHLAQRALLKKDERATAWRDFADCEREEWAKDASRLALAARRAEPAVGECVWREDGGPWGTDCGHRFYFEEGGPEYNGAKFCLYCGRSLTPLSEPEEGADDDD